jgi:hypothetical protein
MLHHTRQPGFISKMPDKTRKSRAGGLKSLGKVLRERLQNLGNRPELANDLN